MGTPTDTPDVTLILERINRGDPRAMEELFPPVYEELRRRAAWNMARERAGHTLQTTALVHEAFVRLVGNLQAVPWESSRHFYNVAAEVMRQLLVDHARRRAAGKRGGGRLQRVDLSDADVAAPPLTTPTGSASTRRWRPSSGRTTAATRS